MALSAPPPVRVIDGRARGPAFNTPVARNGYLWWYLDAVSDDGHHALTLIAFIGSVFSPYYALARRRGRGDPEHHCGLNVALYGRGGKRWALTERGRHDLRRDSEHLHIGTSGLRWADDGLHIDINEVTVPWPSRLRGSVHVMPTVLPTTAFVLDANSRHRWQACAPRARIDLHFTQPALRWQGWAYLDSNGGDEPLEQGFAGWHWSRTHVGDATRVAFDLQPHQGAGHAFAVQFDAAGVTQCVEPGERQRLSRAPLWRIARYAQLPDAGLASVAATFEDTPFYARSLLRQGTGATESLSMHESLDLRRFASPLVQALLPFRMPRRARRSALLIACLTGLGALVGTGPQAHAQEAPRPRIGLALSGGGARGLAHVGVIKVLEELRVPVDCITGTSMGAVVGGAYAAGATAAQMDEVVRTVDWNDLFTDRPPREEMAPRRKQEDYSGYFAPEIGLQNGSLRLAKGVVAGVTIESFLRKLTASAASVNEFAKLPIPFRAVAADIETGQQVVLANGSLPLAMRASMAIPGAVNPVVINGRMLVDGGIANNLPIDLARQTCADVVIAVNIGTPPMKRDEITSALSVVGQLINFLGKERVDRQVEAMGERDVLIKPELGNITAASFDRAADAIRIGELAARALAAQLARYSLPAAQYVALRQQQTRSTERSLGRFDAIEFEGLALAQPAALRQLLDARPGEPLDEDTLQADLRRLFGRGDFDSVDYRIDDTPGRRVLVIRAQEKDAGPQSLRFGLSLNTSLGGDGTSTFNALVSYRRTWVNPLGAEWLVSGQIGRQSRLATEFYQPLANDSPFFVAPQGQLGKSVRALYGGDQHLADLVTREARLGVDLGMALGRWGELRLGPQLRQLNAIVETGPPAVPDQRTTDNGLRLRVFGDQLDAPWFPRRGYRFTLEAYEAVPVLGNSLRYRRVDATLTSALELGEQSIETTLGAASSFGSRLPPYAAITLGGPFQLSGYATEQFAGQQSLFARVRLMHRFLQLPGPLGQGLYGGVSLEAGRIGRSYTLVGAREGTAPTDTLWSGAAFIGADTFLGPAWLGLGMAGSGHMSLFLSLGVP